MTRSTRVIYRNQRGRSRHNFNWGPINKHSAVLVTAAEWRSVVPPNPDDPWGRPNLGDADVYVTNIGPHDPEGEDGGVEFILHVNWHTPLNVQVTITVLGQVEHHQVIG